MDDMFVGDSVYHINCTGDVCVGDQVKFSRAVFSGSYRSPKFSHMEVVEGLVCADSYGSDKGQHTFTIDLGDGVKTFIKGRNLYRNGVYRKPWDNEELRKEVLAEKHKRGSAVRQYKKSVVY